MSMTVKILLLIAAYVRKTNHAEESEAQLMAGVIGDLKKVNAALKTIDRTEIGD